MVPSRGKKDHKKTGHFHKSTSNSIFATFNVNFEACRKYIVVLINKRPVKFQFDSALDIPLISRSTWKLLGMQTLKETTHVACSASGNKIQIIGELICDVSFKKKKKIRCMLHYGLIKPEPSWFGFYWRTWLFKGSLELKFNTCQVNSVADTDKHFMSILKAKFNNVFQGLRCCTKVKATLKLKSDSKPIFRQKRQVPYAALATVENELNSLQQAGVIQPINHPGQHPLSWWKRQTARQVYDVLDIHQYPHRKICSQNPMVELVLQSWTLQMEVDEDSKNLLTISTHKGLFQFCRLPFGV